MRKNNSETNHHFKDIFLYICFGVTLFLSILIVLSSQNICYLPLNTTGECVIARSIMALDHYLLFLIVETVFSIVVTVLYLLDGVKQKNIKYKIVGIANILLQPFVVLALIRIVWW